MKMEWLEDESLKQIAPEKLEFILNLARECEGKSLKQALPVINAAFQLSRKQGLQLTGQEAAVLFHIVQNNSTPEEREKIEKIINARRSSSSSQ